MKEDLHEFLPLSPAILHILLALAGEDRHGYGIMLEVARQSEGRYKLGPGTLYDNLQRLVNQGMVEESPRPASVSPAEDDPRRRYYRLTRFGRDVLAADIARLESVVREAKARLRAASPRRAT
ncbi:MAG: helix-turn-helix transcriptional regulator [Acidobacteriia bacterium]|nr:helix-turn-helix transcriptional regulator [Terriglobia bacterium]MBV8906595.1 helix-turn-helix transcriptional regulator [Terriglobia bacterium]